MIRMTPSGTGTGIRIEIGSRTPPGPTNSAALILLRR
jgi:hypothetical protein